MEIKDNNILNPSMIEQVISLFASGKSETQVAAKLRMSKQKFKSLAESVEGVPLKEAIEYGKTLHEAFFEDLYVEAMMRKVDAKEGLIKSYMQNKFNWNDKTESLEIKSTSSLSDEKLDEELTRLKALAANNE